MPLPSALVEKNGSKMWGGSVSAMPCRLEKTPVHRVQPLRLPWHDLPQPVPRRILGQLLDEGLDGPRERGEGIADLVSNVGGQPSDGGEPVGLADVQLHALDRRQILADADQTDRLAAPGAERPERDAH